MVSFKTDCIFLLLARSSAFAGQSAIKTSRWRGTLVRLSGQKHTGICMARTWPRLATTMLFLISCNSRRPYLSYDWYALRLNRIQPLSLRGRGTGPSATTAIWRSRPWRLSRLLQRLGMIVWKNTSQTGWVFYSNLLSCSILQRTFVTSLTWNTSFGRHKPGKRKEMEKDSKELEQDIAMLPKKLISNHLAAEKTKVKVEVVQQQTEDNAMEE